MKKVTATRKNFLGFMTASPLAAKRAAEKAALELTGKTSLGNTIDYGASISSLDVAHDAPSPSLLRRLFANGLPDWKLSQLKRDSEYVHGIDPDIASMRSISLTAKFRMQKDRRYKQLVRNETDVRIDNYQIDVARSEFQKKHGIWL